MALTKNVLCFGKKSMNQSRIKSVEAEVDVDE